MKNKLLNILTAVILFLMPNVIFGQAPTLGTSANYALFTSIGAITNSGIQYLTHITGNVGTNSDPTLPGFGNVDGAMTYVSDPRSASCAADLLIAYGQLDAAVPTFFPGILLGNGTTLYSGVYYIPAAATLNLDLILDAQGDSSKVFIFQIDGPFSTNANSKVKLVNGALACNVFWKVEGMIDMGTNTTMRGTVIANNAAINMATGDTLEGRALSTNGAITVNGVLIYTPVGCGSPVLVGPAAPVLASTLCYTLFSSIGPVTNTLDPTYVTGDIGTNGSSDLTTGFNPLFVTGAIHPIPDGSTAQAATDLLVAYNYLNSLPYDIELLWPTLFGHNLVLTPHTYLMNAAVTFTDTLYLNAEGDSNAVFVIQVNGAFGAGVNSKVILTNGTKAKNVYWKIDGAIDIAANSIFNGTIVSAGAIDLRIGTTLNGRALTINGALNTAAITAIMPPGCGTPPFIITEPNDTIVCEGDTARFFVVASGDGISYQWRKGNAILVDGGNISGTNTDTLTIYPANVSDTAYNFNVVVSGSLPPNDTSINVSLIVNPLTGATSFTGGSVNVCQNAIDETYTAIASNSTSIVYSVSPATAGIINSSTGVMNWDAAFSGLDTITATSTGLCGTTSSFIVVTVNPSTGATSFTSGAVNVCQNAIDETYTAIASNSTSIVYSVSPATAGIINASTGVMNWDAAFSGLDTITATSTGLCGTTSSFIVVTINPSTGATSFTGGAVTVCQDAADETYSATATNSTSIVYSVLPASAGVIDANTGVINWDAAFNGAATITASSTGLCGTTSADLIVTVNSTIGTTSFISGAITVCQDAVDETYSATATNSTSIVYSVLPASAGVIDASTGVMNWDAAFNGAATITATSTGLCGTTNADLIVTVNPTIGATSFISGAITVCQDAADETYSATATNSTSIVYSVLPASAGVIDAVTGVMNWDATFSGTATITATSTGLCGTTSADLVVTLNPTIGVTSFIGGAISVCQNAADETYSATATNSTSIVYSVLPSSAGVINASTGVMNWDAAFLGTATITATSTGLCGTTSADLLVTVNSIPAAVASTTSPVCIGSSLGLNAQTVSGATYSWSGPNGYSSTSQDTVILSASLNDAGIYSLIVTLNGCVSGTSSQTVVVNSCADLSVVKTVSNSNPVIGNTVTFTIVATNNGPNDAAGVAITDILQSGYAYVSSTVTTGSFDPSTGVWTIGNLSNGSSEILTVTATVLSSGNYVNTAIIYSDAIDANMIDNVSTVETFPTDFFIPEGFSPNADGTNDLFVIRGILNYPENTFVIFNRWGDKVFEASPYQNTWNGKSEIGLRVGGNELPIGTYFYVLDLKDGTPIFKGTIYLNK